MGCVHPSVVVGPQLLWVCWWVGLAPRSAGCKTWPELPWMPWWGGGGGGVWSQAGCVQGFVVTVVGILAVGSGSLSDWLQGPAMIVVGALVYGVGLPEWEPL